MIDWGRLLILCGWIIGFVAYSFILAILHDKIFTNSTTPSNVVVAMILLSYVAITSLVLLIRG